MQYSNIEQTGLRRIPGQFRTRIIPLSAEPSTMLDDFVRGLQGMDFEDTGSKSISVALRIE